MEREREGEKEASEEEFIFFIFFKCAHPESHVSSRHLCFRPTLLYPNTDEETGRGETFSAPQAAGQPAKVSQIISALVASLFWVLDGEACVALPWGTCRGEMRNKLSSPSIVTALS